MIKSLRSKGIQCPVLVFCASFDFHSKWARKFKNVEVAVDTAVMFDFATCMGKSLTDYLSTIIIIFECESNENICMTVG